jgi:tetratricopeptide (TPR) repeat protein
MLPAGTTHSHLDWWAPQLGNKKTAAISALSNVALIVDTELPADDSEVLISVLPVVQSYMQRDRISPAVRDTVRDASYKFVLDHKSSPGDPSFKDDLSILSTEEINIQSILLEVTRNADVMASLPDIEKGLEALISFSWYQHWTKPRTEVIEHGLKLARKAQLEQYIAEFLFCLGSTLFRLDKYEHACKSYIEARDYFRKLPNVVRASECSFELVELYIYMHQPDNAEQALRSVSEEDLDADGYVRARSNLAHGGYCWYKRRHLEAVENLTAAKEAFETQEINRPVDAAYCLQSISRALASMGEFTDAVEAVDQSLKIYEKFGPDNRLVETLLVKDYILLSVKAPFDEVLPTLERTLQKGQELGLPLPIAQALDLLGELHARERKLPSAIKYYKAAEVEYETISQANMVNRGRNNHSQLALMENNPEVKWNGWLLSVALLN